MSPVGKKQKSKTIVQTALRFFDALITVSSKHTKANKNSVKLNYCYL